MGDPYVIRGFCKVDGDFEYVELWRGRSALQATYQLIKFKRTKKYGCLVLECR